MYGFSVSVPLICLAQHEIKVLWQQMNLTKKTWQKETYPIKAKIIQLKGLHAALEKIIEGHNNTTP